MTTTQYDYDVIVVGSGFGGAVSALRMAEKGYRVLVIEQGRHVSPDDMARAGQDAKHLLRMPALGLRKGFFAQEVFRHVSLVRGIGVGGGSLVWAAVMLKPKQAFYDDPAWGRLPPRDWREELAPHYATAGSMLGLAVNPRRTLQDEWLHATAQQLGAADTFTSVTQAIYFGPSDQVTTDPFFDGKGPARKGCQFCAQCATGCPHGAKKSLDKNYLHLATALGVEILSECKVQTMEALPQGGYRVHVQHPWDTRVAARALTAEKVIVSAGVVGTLELLLACRDHFKTLPALSPVLGHHVRTNSESIVPVTARSPEIDVSDGATISTHFFVGDTHITQNRFSQSHAILGWQTGPMVSDAIPWRRALRALWSLSRHPLDSTLAMRVGKQWSKRTSVLLVMQPADNQLAFDYGRSWLKGLRKGLRSRLLPGTRRAPAFLPEANRVAEVFAKISNGVPGNAWLETLGKASVTAHVLGGCVMGGSRDDGVIDENHEVFGYPGLYVVDASAIPANVGVNPSLTVTAFAERAMDRMGQKLC